MLEFVCTPFLMQSWTVEYISYSNVWNISIELQKDLHHWGGGGGGGGEGGSDELIKLNSYHFQV